MYGLELTFQQVVLIQICNSTGRDPELSARISDIVDRINSAFATVAYQPVVLLNQDISHCQYLALLAVSDALLITSLREGMNLISHEYVYSQDGIIPGSKNNGSLILSEFTGSSAVFNGYDIPVNPWNHQQCADAINQSLTMAPEEKKRRWQGMYDRVLQQDARTWHTRLVNELERITVVQASQERLSIPRLSTKSLLAKYNSSTRRLFLLDYDGPIAPRSPSVHTVLMTQQRALNVLTDLAADHNNTVYIFSQRMPEEMEQLLQAAPQIGLVAENGCFLKKPGDFEWLQLIDNEQIISAKASIQELLKHLSERLPGTSIEELHCSMVLHYDDAKDKGDARARAGECASQLNDTCRAQRMRAVPIDSAIAVEPVDCNRHTAALKIMESLNREEHTQATQKSQIDFLLVAGADRTDEILFQWANKLRDEGSVDNVYTVSVGERPTEAIASLAQSVTGEFQPPLDCYNLANNLSGLLSFLQRLATAPKDCSSDDVDSLNI